MKLTGHNVITRPCQQANIMEATTPTWVEPGFEPPQTCSMAGTTAFGGCGLSLFCCYADPLQAPLEGA